MDPKTITIPFNVELAYKIQVGEHPGKIVTRRDFNNVRIVCWDAKSKYPIVSLMGGRDGQEMIVSYAIDGSIYEDGDINDLDLLLQVPDYIKYKDGDILITEDGNPFIFKKIVDDFCYYYAGLNLYGELTFSTGFYFCSAYHIKDYADNAKKQELVEVLEMSEDSRASEYLQRFFGIEEVEENPKCEFEPFDKVLVRDNINSVWICDIFSHISKEFTDFYPFKCVGSGYKFCIPYNEKTKHLVGTTENWEGE